ncbi:hypothetical protein MUP77_00005 [Candidatus Bathyarchaeota archaeon]|nr:hypothetical protein [Candidatus Bathyarchaeota archaeon]
MSKPFLTYHTNEKDAILGERIVLEARKLSKPTAISDKTSRHGAQRVKADKAEAWIERAYVAGTRKF